MAEMNSLEVRVDQQIGLLDWNFEELNIALDGYLEKYRGLQFSDNEIKDAAKICADLNRLAKAINDRKISVKKEFCAPYDTFADQAMKLVNKIKVVRADIDAQVKDYKARQQEEKKAKICAWWDENGKKTIPIEKIWNEKWLNATCSEKEWQNDLNHINEKITSDIYAIAQIGDHAKVDFLLTDYLQTLDVSTSIANWDRMEKARIAAEEEKARIAAAEQAKREAEHATPAPAENVPPHVEPAPEMPKTAAQDDPNDYLYSPTFQMIDLTYAQALSLTNFMKNSGMKFRSIAKDRRKK